MRYFARFSPFAAIRDLRLFLHQRQRHELAFLALAIVMTTLLIAGFVKDSRVERVYKPEITYVQQWTLDRTDAEIVAQQKIDQVKKERDQAELKKRLEERQASFKRLDDKLEKWGL